MSDYSFEKQFAIFFLVFISIKFQFIFDLVTYIVHPLYNQFIFLFICESLKGYFESLLRKLNKTSIYINICYINRR